MKITLNLTEQQLDNIKWALRDVCELYKKDYSDDILAGYQRLANYISDATYYAVNGYSVENAINHDLDAD